MQFNLTSIFAVFAAAMAGSFHCTGMCGGISLSVTEGKFYPAFAYHGARLLGYLSLSFWVGLLGEKIIFSPELHLLGVVSGFVLAGALFIAGMMLWTNRSFHYQNQLSTWIAKKLIHWGFRLSAPYQAATVGFASVFLPCGWLYTFILLGLATHSITGGVVTLFTFWLGTLPALIGGPLLLRNLLKNLALSGKKITALLMMLAGIASIELHYHHSDENPIQGKESEKNLFICH